VSTPELPDNLLQATDEGENWAGPRDIEFREAFKDQFEAIKSDVSPIG
jgi:hypothetical protein